MIPLGRTVEEMEVANAVAGNWVWKSDTWTEAEEWQLFTNKWFNAPDTDLNESFRELDIGEVTARSDVPPMIIRECYREAYMLVWNAAVRSPTTGMILTGQPGIGKTTFLWYLLVSLLQKKQVVLFHISNEPPLLFFDGRVYTPTTDYPDIPERSSKEQPVFIWSLFDLGEGVVSSLAYSLDRCFPVQTPSLDPEQYKSWHRSRNAKKVVFPMWTREELVKGIKMNSHYRSIKSDLQTLIHRTCQDQIWGQPSRSGNVQQYYELLKSYCTQEGPKSEDEAFNRLLDVIILEFGNAIRDVIHGMNAFQNIKRRHVEASKIGAEELKLAVSSVIHGTSDGMSYEVLLDILSLYPEGEMSRQEWKIDFKSVQVGRAVVQQSITESEACVGQLIRRFSSYSKTKLLAGWFFEALACRTIASGTSNSDEHYWTLRKMTMDKQVETKGVTFSLDKEDKKLTWGPEKTTRSVFEFEQNNLPGAFNSSEYYVPKIPNLALIDAFLVDIDTFKNSAVLWILQMAVARELGGKTSGYGFIQRITNILRDQLLAEEERASNTEPLPKRRRTDRPSASISVKYVLVCPEGKESEDSKWNLPSGWDDEYGGNDHRGEGFMLTIPLPPTIVSSNS